MSGRTNMLNCILKVFRREDKIMRSRPIYLYGTILVLAFSAVFLLTLMREGLPQKVPVGVVDLDNSYISRSAIKQIDALQGIKIVKSFSSFKEAREAMQRGEIYGFIEFPDGIYRDAVNGLHPTLPCYYTEAYMVPGTLAYKNFLTMANVLNAGVMTAVKSGSPIRRADDYGPTAAYHNRYSQHLQPLHQLCNLLDFNTLAGHTLSLHNSDDCIHHWF